MMIASFAFFAGGCADIEDGDLTTDEDALQTCGGWHRNGAHHKGHKHRRHRHSRPHATGAAGSSGGAGASGMAGTTGAAGMGIAGTTGAAGTTGMGGTGMVDPRCDEVDGTVSWWHGDDDYDDAAGSNDGMSAGAVAFAAGVNGDGFALSGLANSFVQVPNDPSLQITGSITMDAWINQAAVGGRIIDKVTAFNVDGYLLDVVGDRLRLFVGGVWVVSNAPMPTGTFMHVAGVYNGTSLAVYINGVLSNEIPTAVASIPISDNSVRIGADSTGGSLFNGIIDEPRIFDRALSAAEIATIYYQGTNCH